MCESVIGVIGGFHMPVERDCLAILLRGNQLVVICPASRLAGMPLAGPVKSGSVGRPHPADRAVQAGPLAGDGGAGPYVVPSSKTEALADALLAGGKMVDDAANAGLMALGAQPLATVALSARSIEFIQGHSLLSTFRRCRPSPHHDCSRNTLIFSQRTREDDQIERIEGLDSDRSLRTPKDEGRPERPRKVGRDQRV